MWAACCSWTCCFNGLTEMWAHPQQGTRSQAYSNSSYNSFPSPTGAEQSCRGCGACFPNSSEKYACLDCKKNFCLGCLHQRESGPRLCFLCRRFRATNFQREELMKMKVKDLRDYLERREVSTARCRQKDDLVFLIIRQQPPVPLGDGTTRTTPFTVDTAAPRPDFGVVPQTELPVPTSTDISTATDRADTGTQTEERSKANGHVPLGQDNMAEVENTIDAQNEEQTQQVEQTVNKKNTLVGRRASLSDLTSVRDIDALSVRQLKEILARNFVNYKGCCEKWELMERVTRLYKEKDLQQLVTDTDDQIASADNATLQGPEENVCKICMDSVIDCVLLECGHMVTCTKCGKQMNECPICRQYVVRAVHVFRT